MFESIIGNERNKELLKNVLKNNTISHSYLFVGQDGIGKRLLAKEFAKGILCLDKKDGMYCNKCKSCIQIDTDNHPDFSLLEPDGSSVKIEQIREVVQKIYEKPIISDFKVYIINDAQELTKSASNSLLKTLEEPPEYAIIILISSSETMIIPTIRSRCQKISFKNLSKEEINKYFHESFDDRMYNLFDGSIRKAELTKDKKELFLVLDDIFTKEKNINLLEFLERSKSIYQTKEDIFDILEYMNLLFLEKLKKNVDDNKVQTYLQSIDKIEEAKQNIKGNANFEMTIDHLLFSIYKLEKR